MKGAMTLLALVLLAGCGRCSAPADGPAAPVAVEPSEPSEPNEPVGEAPKAELVYKRAYERARRDLTPEQAASRLREIEREVDRELAELP